MSKETAPEGRGDIPESKILTVELFAEFPRSQDGNPEEQASPLTEQFRFMIKNMKLEVVETMGAMLARRNGIDREIRDQAERVDLLAKMVEDFGKRLSEIEKTQGIRPSDTWVHRSRDLTEPRSKIEEIPSPPAPAPVAPEHRLGRPPGKGSYEVYNAAKRARKAGGTL